MNYLAINRFAVNVEAVRSLVGLAVQQRDKELSALLETPVKSVVVSMFPHLAQEAGTTVSAGDVTTTGSTNGDLKVELTAKTSEEMAATMQALLRLERSSRQYDLSLCGALVSLLSVVEWFFADILSAFFELHPKVIGEERCLSLEELTELGSIDAARHRLIQNQVEKVLRGEFRSWIEFLHERTQVDLQWITPHLSLIEEIFQRRNVFVHNDGLANKIYLSRVAPEFRKDLKEGALIPLKDSYLRDAIDLIEQQIILFAAETWKREKPNDEERGNAMLLLTYSKIVSGEYECAAQFANFVVHDKKQSEHFRLSSLLNYWQAKKWSEKFAEVQDDVSSADFSAKGDLFQFARLVLMDDFQQATSRMEHLLDSGALAYEALATWPIFKELRNTDEYAKLFATRNERFTEAIEKSKMMAELMDVLHRLLARISARPSAAQPKALPSGAVAAAAS